LLISHGPLQLNRRNFLRIGALGCGGLSLVDLLRSEARASTGKRPKSIIYIVLDGGPSHIDMYDLKPDAPDEYRGPFQPIATSLTGVRIGEHLPLQAALMHKLALLRGIKSVENDHFLSEVYTGLPRTAGRRPAFGSIVSRLAPSSSALPTYVSLERPSSGEFDFELPHYAGVAHAPFRPFGSALDNLAPPKQLDRLQDRKQLLATFDSMNRELDRNALTGLDRFQQQALQMIASPKVRDAFDLSKEPEKVRLGYGKGGKYTHQTYKTIVYDFDSRPFLLARRLVEAGVRVVTLRVSQWDHHSSENGDIFFSLKLMLPALDRAFTALIGDLEARGLSEDVLVVMLGEFGRTPKIGKPGPGREHHADAGCAILAGGGLVMGQVIGETDSRAERAKTGSIGFQNIMATIYKVMGVDPIIKLPDFNGRPQHILADRQPIRELVD
jgi:hypothetical protein